MSTEPVYTDIKDAASRAAKIVLDSDVAGDLTDRDRKDLLKLVDRELGRSLDSRSYLLNASFSRGLDAWGAVRICCETRMDKVTEAQFFFDEEGNEWWVATVRVLVEKGTAYRGTPREVLDGIDFHRKVTLLAMEVEKVFDKPVRSMLRTKAEREAADQVAYLSKIAYEIRTAIGAFASIQAAKLVIGGSITLSSEFFQNIPDQKDPFAVDFPSPKKRNHKYFELRKAGGPTVTLTRVK